MICSEHLPKHNRYIVDFTYSRRMAPKDAWKWTVSADWGLLKVPEGDEDDEYWVPGYDFRKMIR